MQGHRVLPISGLVQALRVGALKLENIHFGRGLIAFAPIYCIICYCAKLRAFTNMQLSLSTMAHEVTAALKRIRATPIAVAALTKQGCLFSHNVPCRPDRCTCQVMGEREFLKGEMSDYTRNVGGLFCCTRQLFYDFAPRIIYACQHEIGVGAGTQTSSGEELCDNGSIHSRQERRYIWVGGGVAIPPPPR